MPSVDKYDPLKCQACGEVIEPGPEDALKLFKLHVKREHKSDLQRVPDGYRQFLSAEDWEVVKGDGRV
jgi:hypothetical protein